MHSLFFIRFPFRVIVSAIVSYLCISFLNSFSPVLLNCVSSYSFCVASRRLIFPFPVVFPFPSFGSLSQLEEVIWGGRIRCYVDLFLFFSPAFSHLFLILYYLFPILIWKTNNTVLRRYLFETLSSALYRVAPLYVYSNVKWLHTVVITC